MPINLTKELHSWEINYQTALGKGGYASVWPCRRTSSGEFNAAIKIFKNTKYANAFEKEVTTLQALAGCPNTAQLIDFGINEKGDLCIVSERIFGQTLREQIVSSGVLEQDQAVQLLNSVLDALRYAHDSGVAHLDIKGDNIMVHGDKYYILDWGVGERLEQGFICNIKGNKDYTAPECFLGTFSQASDFYSLGLLLLYALCGANPYYFDQIPDHHYKALAHCLGKPELPQTLNTKFAAIILNWIRKDPDQRYISYDTQDVIKNACADNQEFVRYKYLGILQSESSYLESAARKGITYSQYQLGKKLLKEGRVESAVDWLAKAYFSGSSHAAACLLAKTLIKTSPETEKERINQLLQFAASRENPLAQNLLAKRIIEGKAIGSTSEADALLRSAADAGHNQSQYLYARRLFEREADKDLVTHYLAKAALRGNWDAASFLESAWT